MTYFALYIIGIPITSIIYRFLSGAACPARFHFSQGRYDGTRYDLCCFLHQALWPLLFPFVIASTANNWVPALTDLIEESHKKIMSQDAERKKWLDDSYIDYLKGKEGN